MERKPAFRKLRCYALDPFLSAKVDTLDIHHIEYVLNWEDLEVGPVGEYLEIIDYDPTTGTYYKPVDLNEVCILVENGLDPSESNPQFHQQMVYAVCMKTIENFEKALGRKIMWSKRRLKDGSYQFVQKLRIYPHALRDANAYYSPHKKALLFGYFQATNRNPERVMPRSLIFSCLSHDIVAHEITHAIIDGLFKHYNYATNPDVLAFHEAFSDIIALFQHFTFPEVLRHQIAKTRGRLEDQNLLGGLAVQFGSAIGGHGSLRDAIGSYDSDGNWQPHEPTAQDYRNTMQPHSRGSILVAAVFDAFLIIYKKRVADLLRLASGGTGILPQGDIHPDLVNRLSNEAAKAASHILGMCIRAMDYCPGVDINFGDFLRSIITADVDLVKSDSRDYRVAFIEAFKKRGIYPGDIRTLSVESLTWDSLGYKYIQGGLLEKIKAEENENLEDFTSDMLHILIELFEEYGDALKFENSRQQIYSKTMAFLAGQVGKIESKLKHIIKNDTKGTMPYGFGIITGLIFSPDVALLNSMGIDTKEGVGIPLFQIEDLHTVSRVGPDGNQINRVVLTLCQTAGIRIENGGPSGRFIPSHEGHDDDCFLFHGSSTLIFDMDHKELKYAINKPLIDIEHLKKTGKFRLDKRRLENQYLYMFGFEETEVNEFNAYFGQSARNQFQEPFSLLHNH